MAVRGRRGAGSGQWRRRLAPRSRRGRHDGGLATIAAIGGTLTALLGLSGAFSYMLFRILRQEMMVMRQDLHQEMVTMRQDLIDRMDRNHRDL